MDSRTHWLRASAFWVRRMGLGAVGWEIHNPLLASLAWRWDAPVFLGGDMVCHLQPRHRVQLIFWSPLQHSLLSVKHRN